MDIEQNHSYSRIIAKYNEECLTEKMLLESTEGIRQQLNGLTIENNVIGIEVSSPLMAIIAINAVLQRGSKVCMLHAFEKAEYKKYEIREKNLSVIISDKPEQLKELIQDITILKINNFDCGQKAVHSEKKITGNIEYKRTPVEADDYLLQPYMLKNWINFVTEVLDIDLCKAVMVQNKAEPLNIYYLMLPLLTECTLHIIDATEQSTDEIIDGTSSLNKKTYLMSLKQLREFEFSIMMSESDKRIFENIITFGNSAYDLCSLKEYCNNIGIRWYNFYGNEYAQFVTVLRKDAMGEIFHLGKEIRGVKAFVMNQALNHMPLGVPGTVYAVNKYAEEAGAYPDEYIKTEFKGKRLKDGKIQFTGFEQGVFYYNERLCSTKYINHILEEELSISKIKIGWDNQRIYVFYAVASELSYQTVQDIAVQYIPYFYPEINFIHKRPEEMERQSVVELRKNNNIPGTMEIMTLKNNLQKEAGADFLIHFTYNENGTAIELYYDRNKNILIDMEVKEKIESIICQYIMKCGCFVDYLIFYSVEDECITDFQKIKKDMNFELLRNKAEKVVIELNNKNTLTKRQRDLYDIWRKILNREHINLDDNFFHIGGSSVLFVKLIYELSNYSKKEIPMTALMGNATLRTTFRIMEMDNIETTESIERIMLKDTNIDKYLVNYSKACNTQHEISNIFLTGGNGFIGAFLLKELIMKTSAKIYCLIRADNESHAYKRIFTSMNYYKLLQYFDKNRIIPVIGDMGKDRFGLGAEEYDRLASVIDVIFHNAASANFLYSYEMLKNENVTGSGRMIEFATTHKIKPIHFISSLAIFGVGNKEVVTEQSIPDNPKLPRTGYSKSKWVSDQMMLNARKKNIPCNIYRIGNACGDSVHGICQTKDFIWMLLKLGIEIETLPDYYDIPFSFITVDSIASSIIGLALDLGNGYGENYHIIEKQRVFYKDIVNWVQSYGYNVKTMPYKEWVAMIKEYTNKQDTGMLQSIPAVIDIEEDVPDDFEFVSYDNSFTLNRVKKIKEKIIPLQEKLFHKHLEYFIQMKFIKDLNE